MAERSTSCSTDPLRSAGRSSSRERMALPKACRKVRPMAIASPTDFICVESSDETPGNFSKAKRGHLTTT